MSDDSLERILEFNRELATLSSIGVPLDIPTERSESIASRLQQISSALQSRVQRGQSIEQALAEEPLVSLGYQTAALAWVHCDDPTVALDVLSTGAVARRYYREGFKEWIAYPLVVAIFTYVGLLVLCAFTVPRIESLLNQMGVEATGTIAWLIEIRAWLPVWSVAVPLSLLALVAWQRRRPRGQLAHEVAAKSGYLAAARRADIAERVTRLVDSGMGKSESKALLGQHLVRGGDRAAEEKSLPPLLGWALSDDLDDQSRPAALRMVAKTYRLAAERKGRIWRTVVSGVIGVLVGGVFVLGYATTVFVAMSELLRDVARGGGL